MSVLVRSDFRSERHSSAGQVTSSGASFSECVRCDATEPAVGTEECRSTPGPPKTKDSGFRNPRVDGWS